MYQPFYKMQANGNDFVVFAGLERPLPHSGEFVKLCDRHFGVGADGVIFIQPLPDRGLEFIYYNADGSRGAMCANGARCALRLACLLGWYGQGEWIRLKADDGWHDGRVLNGLVQVQINIPGHANRLSSEQLDISLPCEHIWHMDTGVPHLIVWGVDSLDTIDVERMGRLLRHHPLFQPAGVNVNFVEQGPMQLRMRTYERGVERETLSCGTGVAAAGMIFTRHISPGSESVDIHMPGGTFQYKIENKRYFLDGPAQLVFEGRWNF
ncbi:MAG: diaminopimelate epimerase [Calditrichaeota bacterium]|nr:MAG: diaminopimelate epimerase [Calditrichota bacterium]